MRIARLPVALATAFALVALPDAAAAVKYTKMKPASNIFYTFTPPNGAFHLCEISIVNNSYLLP